MGREAETFLTKLAELFKTHEQTMFAYHKKFFDDYNKLLEDVRGRQSAKNLVDIQENTEYDKDKFFTLHCIESNNEPCTIITHMGEVVFPPKSFVVGAMYPINLQCLKKSGGVRFIGYVS